ncbi:hypothetical protein C8A01DRAFT_49133 [Parachaetomium inaequale]|uniref:Aminoglycoside phosphotransferase domain-containing protein n=1 Tax=Parachaetomium inaequale TaxID=2588326 RepID=A0AAN6PA40_9PEZI|nr:hypothetical protein C8A01DRAFT_49133 [Parachaetomium inaequale]
MMICEKVDSPESKPADTIVDWKGGESVLCLRSSSGNELCRGVGYVAADRVHVGGPSAAVHAWVEGIEQHDTIDDHDLDRKFLVTKRVEGQTLEQAWPWLSSPQRIRVADDVGRVCAIPAANTSSRFETVTGRSVHEPRPIDDAPKPHPTWKPRLFGPLSQERCLLTLGFTFYHADLGPTNVLVSDDGDRATGIIEWESGAYYPRFYVASKPASGAFGLECETEDPERWGQLLAEALQRHGYKVAAEYLP